jgi:hypothetical protein
LEATAIVLNLSAVFRTTMPVAATMGTTMAATSTPPSAEKIMMRPTALVFPKIQFKICTRHSVRGRARYYCSHVGG